MRTIINKSHRSTIRAAQQPTPTPRRPLRTHVALALIGAISLGACSTPAEPAAGPTDAASPSSSALPEVTGPRITVTYDGGLLVLDRKSLEPVADLKLDGFLRINPVGDQRHLVVSTAEGFRVLDTGVVVEGHGDHSHFYGDKAELTSITFPAPEPGHAVRHAGKLALFSDGAGTVHVLDPHDITKGPTTPTWTAPAAHHGVAIPLEGGGLLVSVGTDKARTGAAVLDSSMKPIAESADCPNLHGEATTGKGTILAGCTDGVLLYKDGTFVKIDSPDAYGRIGNQAGSEHSEIVLGDYKVDEKAELERPTRVALVDTANETLTLVELGTSYSFRSLGRGPQGEALVLGTDGKLHIIDPATAKVTRSIPVTKEWTESTTWQDPRPTLMVEGSIAYVTEPASKQLHVVDLNAATLTQSATLPEVPNEISGVGGEAHDH